MSPYGLPNGGISTVRSILLSQAEHWGASIGVMARAPHCGDLIPVCRAPYRTLIHEARYGFKLAAGVAEQWPPEWDRTALAERTPRRRRAHASPNVMRPPCAAAIILSGSTYTPIGRAANEGDVFMCSARRLGIDLEIFGLELLVLERDRHSACRKRCLSRPE